MQICHLLICPLDPKFAQFKDFYLIFLFLIKREAPILQWVSPRTLSSRITSQLWMSSQVNQMQMKSCSSSKQPQKCQGDSTNMHFSLQFACSSSSAWRTWTSSIDLHSILRFLCAQSFPAKPVSFPNASEMQIIPILMRTYPNEVLHFTQLLLNSKVPC